MAFTTEEQALRSALDEVTLGQPEAPVDRAGAVRRRYARRRQLQAATAAVAVAVFAAGAVVVGGNLSGGRSTEPLNRPLPSWALPWADHRDGSVPQATLTSAVTGWVAKQRADAPLPASQAVQMSPAVWYLGQRIPGTDRVVAVFEARGLHAGALQLTNGTRLVVATAAWNDVKFAADKNSKASDAWTFVDVAAPSHDYPGFIGGYLPVPAGADGIHNIVWLLTSPSYRRVQTSVGAYDLRNGFVVFDARQLRIKVEASFQDASGRYPTGGYVGIPGAPASHVPTLAPAGHVTGYPQGPLTLGESGGQGSSTYVDGDAHAPAGRATTIYARCYSAGDGHSIKVAIDALDPAHLHHAVTIPCDLRQHVVPGNVTGASTSIEGVAHSQGHDVSVRAPDLIAWTVAVVIAKH